MKVLLVEPAKSQGYWTTYPPLALLKISAYHKRLGDETELVKGNFELSYKPDIIYITSLFTYAYKPVDGSISFYRSKYPSSRILVGGIYATLCSDTLNSKFARDVEIHKGLYPNAENLLPDYSLVPDWKTSLVISSRGCIRRCRFCSANLLEPEFKALKTIEKLIWHKHKNIVFWDNNFLASPFRDQILYELAEIGKPVDFNQGLDARLLEEKTIIKLKQINLKQIRLAYDTTVIRKPLMNAVKKLKGMGFRGRKIFIYCLYNYRDEPADLLSRIQDILEWGAIVYPMRYEPIEARPKNTYIGRNWDPDQLEMVAKARRVLGYGGAFPPHEGLKKKFLEASCFEDAFRLTPG